jgi:hypothetical protein
VSVLPPGRTLTCGLFSSLERNPERESYVLSQYNNALTSPRRQSKGLAENARPPAPFEHMEISEKVQTKARGKSPQEKKPTLNLTCAACQP